MFLNVPQEQATVFVTLFTPFTVTLQFNNTKCKNCSMDIHPNL